MVLARGRGTQPFISKTTLTQPQFSMTSWYLFWRQLATETEWDSGLSAVKDVTVHLVVGSDPAVGLLSPRPFYLPAYCRSPQAGGR